MKKQLHRSMMRILSYLLCLLLLFTQFSFIAFAEETKNGTVNGSLVNIRTGPSTSHNKTGIQLNPGDPVTILGEHADDAGGSIPWYQISFTYNGSQQNGYIRSDFVTINAPSNVPVVENKDFEAQLAAFPESYKEALRALHAIHPSWNFEAVDTGLDWTFVQEKENRLGWSYINDGIISHYSTAPGSYDWETDVYDVKEGSNWYQAHPDVVAYYMDPRNFLNENDLFQFEKLAFSSPTQTEEAIAAMLVGTFMEGKTTSNSEGAQISYARAFLDAASQYNVSAFHLVTRCIQEVGRAGSACAHGTYPGYENFYNFFNIGAHNGAEAGMIYARDHGWNTPYAAIMAGGSFISSDYIARGQNTPYFQKYNVIEKHNVAGHQYMTNVVAALSEGRIQRKGYVQNGLIESAFTFRIPFFSNMPATCPMPAAAGSPNNFLKHLAVEGYSLTPTFDFYDSLRNGVSDYSLVIEGDVPTVNISAFAVSSSAKLIGNVGNIPIATGKNDVRIVCIAANGASRIYTIHIELKGQGSAEGPPEVDFTPGPGGWNPPYAIRGTNLSGIAPGTDSGAFLASLGVYGSASASLTDENGSPVSGTMRTGMYLNYFDGSYMSKYRIVVYGDINGDSVIDAIDLLLIRKNLLGLTTPSEAFRAASDVNHDGAVDAIDLLLVRKQLLGLYSITQ